MSGFKYSFPTQAETNIFFYIAKLSTPSTKIAIELQSVKFQSKFT